MSVIFLAAYTAVNFLDFGKDVVGIFLAAYTAVNLIDRTSPIR